MKIYTLACSGYSADKQEDLLIVRIDESGQFEVSSSCRQGENPSFCVRRGEYLYTVEEVEGAAAIRAWRITETLQEPITRVDAGPRLETMARADAESFSESTDSHTNVATCLLPTDMRIEVPGGFLCHLHAGEQALFGSSYETGDFFAVDYELKEVLWHRKPAAFGKRDAMERKEANLETEETLAAVEQSDNERQECPHAHWTMQQGNELFMADLGSDRIWRYRLEEALPAEELSPLVLERGAGPRQPLAVKCDGTSGEANYLVSIQELDSTLRLWKRVGEKFTCVDKIRTTGRTCENFPGTICLAESIDAPAPGSADCVAGASVNDPVATVLVCNRGANTISAVSVSADGLKLCGEWETANWPRHLMRVADTNLFVNSCDRAGKLVVFAWESDALVKKGEIDLPGASCAAML